MSCEGDVTILYLSSIPSQYYFLQKIDRFCILHAYLPSEAMRLNRNITFVARNNGNTCSILCPQMHTCLWARDTNLLAEGDVQTMRREHFDICISFTLRHRFHPWFFSRTSTYRYNYIISAPLVITIDNNYYHDSPRAYIILLCYVYHRLTAAIYIIILL